MSKLQNKSPKVQAKPNSSNNTKAVNNSNSNGKKWGVSGGGKGNNANNNGNNASGGKKKQIPPIVIKKSKITTENCYPGKTSNPLRFISSVNKNKQQIHHNFECPADLHVDGKFLVKFPICKSSPINVMVGENEKDRGYNIHLDIYGNYDVAYAATVSEVDTLLSKFNANTTAKQLEEDLKKVLLEKNFKLEEITEIMEDNIPGETEMTGDYYRQVATALIIRQHLATDKVGQDLYDFCVKFRKDYCDWLDANKTDKTKIYDAIGIESKLVKKPASRCVNHVYNHTKYPEDIKNPLSKKIDYSKSPTINFKIHESVPKADNNTNTDKLLIISESGQAMWSKIYDYVANPLATRPISTYEEFERMLYCKGDSAAGIKSFFKQMVQIDAIAPCVFWGEVQRRGSFQFKIHTMWVSGYIPLTSGVKETTPEELNKTQAKIRKAMAYYNVTPVAPVAPVLTQQPQNNNNNNNNESYSGEEGNENGEQSSNDNNEENENGNNDDEEEEEEEENGEVNEFGKRPSTGDDVRLDANDKVVKAKRTIFRV